MLSSHMESIETKLLSEYQVSSLAGHNINKGTPREIFIKNFLKNHLSSTVAIGSGELIDSTSKPGESRNQFDIVVYKNNYPKIHLADDINVFLIESVVSTIEVKSILDKKALKQAMEASRNSKKLQTRITRSISTGYIPPKILNYVVAYTGPVSLMTVYNWISEICNELQICYPEIDANQEKRLQTASPSLDGIFILGKGFIYFDNIPVGFITNEQRNANPKNKWVVIDKERGGLLFLFIMLLQSVSNLQAEWLNAVAYLQNFQVQFQFLP